MGKRGFAISFGFMGGILKQLLWMVVQRDLFRVFRSSPLLAMGAYVFVILKLD
jgi:hypothetical protein